MKLEESLKTRNFRSDKHKAILNLMYTTYLVKSTIAKALKNIDLTIEQFNVLRILKGSDTSSLCVKEIAERLIEKNSNVPRIADRLTAKNLVKRACGKQDKRETHLGLTPQGLEKLRIASTLLEKTEDEMFGLDQEDSRLLNELLEKIR